MIKRTLAVLMTLALISGAGSNTWKASARVPTATPATTLAIWQARYFAKQYMQTRARCTDADGYSVGHCSRLSSRVVRCDANIYYVGGPSCDLSVQVRLEGTSDVYVKGRNTVC